MRRVRRRGGTSNGPPADQGWAWVSEEHLRSPAWRAMPLCARIVVEGVQLEHIAHAGTMNGKLTVTYDDFAGLGLASRNAVSKGVRIAEALGFLDVTFRGRRSFGGARLGSSYGLTWMPRADGTPASNRWRRIKSIEEAAARTREALAIRPATPSTRKIAQAIAA